MVSVSRSIAVAAIVLDLALSANTAVQAETNLYEPVAEDQLSAAQAWFERNNISPARLQSMSPRDRAAVLTFYVYKFCRVGSEAPGSLAQLYYDCATQCGGYSYVHRGLAEAVGLTTRYARLYNIPNQGNHVAVEVLLKDGEWGYFDPTFGAYFTNPESSQQVLDLRGITTASSLELLETNVKQANKDYPLDTDKPIDEIFDAAFDHQYMSINNYRVTEAISNDNPDEYVVLEIPLQVESGQAAIGSFEYTEVADLSKVWLEQTNASLNDADEFNDVSYVTSQLTNMREDRTTIISLNGLKPNRNYAGRIRVINPSNEDRTIQLTSLGRGVQMSGSGLITLEPGMEDVEFTLKARRSFGQTYIRNIEPGGIVYMFGVNINYSEE